MDQSAISESKMLSLHNNRNLYLLFAINIIAMTILYYFMSQSHSKVVKEMQREVSELNVELVNSKTHLEKLIKVNKDLSTRPESCPKCPNCPSGGAAADTLLGGLGVAPQMYTEMIAQLESFNARRNAIHFPEVLPKPRGMFRGWLGELFLRLHRLLHYNEILPYSWGFGTDRDISNIDVSVIARQMNFDWVATLKKRFFEGITFQTCMEWGVTYLPILNACKRFVTFKHGPARVVNPSEYHGDLHNCSHVPTNSMDLIMATQVFEHVKKPWIAIKELYRIVAPGGYVIFTTPFAEQEHGTPYDYYRYTRFGLQTIFEETDFCQILYEPGGNQAIAAGVSMGLNGIIDITPREFQRRDKINWYMPYNIRVILKKPMQGERCPPTIGLAGM